MAETISLALGYTYTVAWSASFYPQAVLNYQRKTTAGLSHEFLYLNAIAFTCYTVYNIALFSSSAIRREYQQRNYDALPAVQLNDVLFALHGLLSVLFQLFQTRIYERAPGQGLNKTWRRSLAVVITLIFAVGFASLARLVHPLDFIYFLSYVKLALTFTKYLPQLRLNFVRKSTEGWSIWNIVLDALGGILSIAQLFLDSSLADSKHPLRAVGGNISKLVLGLISLGFDFAFIGQHLYYRHNEPIEDAEEQSNERDPLIR